MRGSARIMKSFPPGFREVRSCLPVLPRRKSTWRHRLTSRTRCYAAMLNVCLVTTCPNHKSKNARRGLRFVVLPKDEPRRSKWLRRAGRQDDTQHLPMTPRFCHDHFDQSEFFCAEDMGRSQLRWNAMLTLLLPVEDVIETSLPKRQKVMSNDTGATSGVLVPSSSPEHQDNGAVEPAKTGQGSPATNTLAVVAAAPPVAAPPGAVPPATAIATEEAVPSSPLSPGATSISSGSETTYFPTRGEDFESDQYTSGPPEGERQSLVFESCLRELFSTCHECSIPCNTTIRPLGTLIKVKSICPLKHERIWDSQPLMNGRAAGNILLSSHLLFSGSSVTSTLRMLRHMNVEVFSDQTFYTYQKSLLFPAIDEVYLQEQQDLVRQLEDQDVDSASDGRFGSPGFSVKCLTYTAHVKQINKILHSIQVQLGESERAMASVNIEKESLIKLLEFFKEKRIYVKSSGTAIRKHMEVHEPGTAHYFDIWHISKSVKKKLNAAGKRAGCQPLEEWTQATTIHMYWSAMAAGGNRELLVEIWLSLQNHVIDKHAGHGGSYTRFVHNDILEATKMWMDPNSPAYSHYKQITRNTCLLKDLVQMSPHSQTFALESFHSVLIDFAPKSRTFTPEGMRARTRVAILHFNENADRCQAATREGKPRWAVKTSKARKGHYMACPVKTAPTYSYVHKLVEEVIAINSRWRCLATATKASTDIFPAPMTAAIARPSKEELVEARRSRFGRGLQ
ncbi:unnamed protein product [Ixodes pacificus]